MNNIRIAYIPAGNLGTIILAGCLFPAGYGVKIGLFPGDLPREERNMEINTASEFRRLRLMHATSTHSGEVAFSEAELFANGTEKPFAALNLNTVLRTILPDDGITVLQFMVKRHGMAIGLEKFSAADRYTSTIYEAIGGPLVEDKKSGLR